MSEGLLPVVQGNQGEESTRVQKRTQRDQGALRVRQVFHNGVAKEEVKGLSFEEIGGFFERSSDEQRRKTRSRLQQLRLFLSAVKHLLDRVEKGHRVAPSGKLMAGTSGEPSSVTKCASTTASRPPGTTDGSTPTEQSTAWMASGIRERGETLDFPAGTTVRWLAVDPAGNAAEGQQLIG